MKNIHSSLAQRDSLTFPVQNFPIAKDVQMDCLLAGFDKQPATPKVAY